MGCVSSSYLEEDDGKGGAAGGSGLGHHIVSLTSTTYGLLTTLDGPATPTAPSPPGLPPQSPSLPDAINSWELMADLDTTASPPKSSYGQKAGGRSLETFEPRCSVLSPPKSAYGKKAGGRSLETFERRCPPGGAECVVVYTTSLRGIRKTFEDCNAVRAVLEGTGVSVKERDVSMDMGFREELRELMRGTSDDATVPRVFVRGRYVGGAEQVLKMHEEGWLGNILEGLPKCGTGVPCDGCGDARFLPCFRCCGCRKVVIQVLPAAGKQRAVAVKCPDCNENGLVLCPICC